MPWCLAGLHIRTLVFAGCHAGLSIDLDHSCAAFFGSTSFMPYLCQAISAMVVSTLAVIWGRSPTMASSNDEVHWSLLYFIAGLVSYETSGRQAMLVVRPLTIVEDGVQRLEIRRIGGEPSVDVL